MSLTEIKTDDIRKLFPFAPKFSVLTYWPHMLDAFIAAKFTRPLTVIALATVAAETGGSFQPVSEGESRFNTRPGGPPFGLYDGRVGLGNTQPGDGARFKGRGFVQITGRANYQRYGNVLGVDLVGNPELANESETASRILARFISDKSTRLMRFMTIGDVENERRLVNGGTNGLDRYKEVRRLAFVILPIW